MTGSIRPVRVEGRYFWVGGKRVRAFPPRRAVLHALIGMLTCPVGRSSW